MRKILVPAFALVILFSNRPIYALDQREFGHLQEPCELSPDLGKKLEKFIDIGKAEIRNSRDAREILALFFRENPDSATCLNLVAKPSGIGAKATKAEEQCQTATNVNIDAKDFYAILHVVKWGNPATQDTAQSAGQDKSKSTQSGSGVNPAPPSPPNPGEPPKSNGNGTASPSILSTQPAPGGRGADANNSNGVFPDTAADTSSGGNSGSSVLKNAGGTQSVEKQNWYVYHNGDWDQDDFATRKHIPGQQRVWMIYIHLNRKEFYKVSYDVAITKLVPKPWLDLRDLAELAVQARGFDVNKVPDKVWGGACIPVNSLPSQIEITPQFVPTAGEPQMRSLGDVVDFNNEGSYRFDFSVGVPIRKISELDFSSTDMKVGAKKIDSQVLFALADLYFQPVDFQRQTFSRWPFLVLGVGLTGKPLDRGLVALGWGSQLVSIYAGVAILREDRPANLKSGDTATSAQLSSDLRTHRQGQFAFGLHLSARAVLDLLKKQK